MEKSPGLQCDLLHEISNPVLYQRSICFDKEFNIIGCEKSACFLPFVLLTPVKNKSENDSN